MKTRKHLSIISVIMTLFMSLSILGTIISLITAIAGEGVVPLIICASSTIVLYLSNILFKAFIEIYDATVTKNKI